MATQILNPPPLRFPAILLVLTPLPFVGVFASGVIGFVGKLDSTFDQITPEVMATIRLPWMLIFSFLFMAVLFGMSGLAIVANQLKNTPARLWAWLTIIGALASLIIRGSDTYLRLTMVEFSEVTLGQTTQWQLAYTLAYFSHLVMLATICATGIGLYVSGWLRRTGLVIGGLSGVLLVAGLIPSISDKIPPFVFVFFWLALGIGLLRRRTT